MVRLAFTALYTSMVVAIESAGAQGLTPKLHSAVSEYLEASPY